MTSQRKPADRRRAPMGGMGAFWRPTERRGTPPSQIDPRIILNIRWLAIAGQVAALLFTFLVLGFEIPIAQALFVIGLSVAMNVWQTRRAMITHQRPGQNLLALMVDILQLTALLFFTGGLLNPFAVLLLAPVVISATMLNRRETLRLIIMVIVSVTFLALYNYPLPWEELPFGQSDLYLTGLWMAMVVSVSFIGVYAWWVASRGRRLDEALSEAKLVLAKENQVAALGTLATAAAHRLGSPLNTITVIAHELARTVTPDDPLHEDITLLRAEAERCRVILGELNDYQSAETMDLESPVPLDSLISEILSNRLEVGDTAFDIQFDGRSARPMPMVRRRPEIIHALEDLLRNASEFAETQVDVLIRCTQGDVKVTISDDGPGFTAAILSRVGAPWNTSRRGKAAHRGLGIFIASTLIEALGGSILYGNGTNGGGEVKITVPRQALAF